MRRRPSQIPRLFKIVADEVTRLKHPEFQSLLTSAATILRGVLGACECRADREIINLLPAGIGSA